MAQDAPFFAPGAYDADAEQIRRRMQYAQALQQQGQDQPQGQMVSGRYVAPSWTQGLASMLKQFGGAYMQKKAGQDLQNLSAQRNQEQAADIQGFMEALRGKPGTPGTPAVAGRAEIPAAFGVPGVAATEGTPEVPGVEAVPGDQDAALVRALSSRSPMVQGLGAGLVQSQLKAMEPKKPIVVGRSLLDETGKVVGTDATWEGEQRAAREARKAELEAKSAADYKTDRQRAEDRAELVRLTASLRPASPEPLVPVLTTGSTTPVLLPRSQAVGQQPWNPQAAKTQGESEKQAAGKQMVSDSVSELKNYYDVLKDGGGITSTQNGVIANAGAKIADSGIGQFGASLAGSQQQKARESIAQARPLLMSAIKNATGLSAQQMNSNAELMFYMQAATDPSKGYETNMDALKRLDKMFGLGLMGKEDEAKPEGGWDSGGKPPSTPKRIKYDAKGNPIP